MAERTPLSKKIRFEVFKRDKFTCQYCGRMSPDVILEVDHIKPVAEGGDNDMLNLITSCQDCNRGKGKTLLSQNETLKKSQKQLIILAEKAEQAQMMIMWKKELLTIREKEVAAIVDLIVTTTGIKGVLISQAYEIRKILMQFPFRLVWEATEIGLKTYFAEQAVESDYEIREVEHMLHKIGGICYNIQKREREQNGREQQAKDF